MASSDTARVQGAVSFDAQASSDTARVQAPPQSLDPNMMMQMQANMMEVLRSVSDPNKNTELISYMREKDELDRKRQDERDNRILDTLDRLASNRNVNDQLN